MSSNKDLQTLIESLIEEALEEAGPLGYLSKTNRPDPKTAWSPEAQAKWVDARGGTIPAVGSQPPAKTAGAGTHVDNPQTNLGTINPQPGQLPTPEPDDKTNAGIPSQKAGAAQAKPTPSIADVTALLQRASKEEIQQIYAILDKGNPVV